MPKIHHLEEEYFEADASVLYLQPSGIGLVFRANGINTFETFCLSAFSSALDNEPGCAANSGIVA